SRSIPGRPWSTSGSRSAASKTACANTSVPADNRGRCDIRGAVSATRSVSTTTGVQRRLPIGAEVQPGGVHFRVWAPRRRSVTVTLEGEWPGAAREAATTVALTAEPGGYHSGTAPGAAAGTLYRFRLDDDPASYP